jgi:hypothetical protein
MFHEGQAVCMRRTVIESLISFANLPPVRSICSGVSCSRGLGGGGGGGAGKVELYRTKFRLGRTWRTLGQQLVRWRDDLIPGSIDCAG